MERFLSEKYSTELLSKGSNKLDLTLKLSPCRENEEKMRVLLRSSSSVAMEIGKKKNSVDDESQWGPFKPSLDRSCSLPAEAEKGLVRFEELKRMKKVETLERKRMLIQRQRKVSASVVETKLGCGKDKLKALANGFGDSKNEDTFTSGSYNIPHKDQNPRPSTEEEVSSNSIMQTPSKQENHTSKVSKKTTMPKEIPPQLEKSAKNVKLGNYCSLKGDVMEILRQMPSVTTTGDGPNGKRIEGFLYKYMNGQVCIVCVCHGKFLTPAEFVKHAGGKEVANPMKHITVYSN